MSPKREWLKRWAPRFECDPNPFARGGSVCICVASIICSWQAWLLTISAATANATPIGALIYLLTIVGQEFGAPFALVRWLPAILWATATIAFFGAIFRLGWIRLALFLPQNLILGGMAIGGVIAAMHGSYLDGTVKPWEHISADQAWCLGFWLVHCSAILRRARAPNG